MGLQLSVSVSDCCVVCDKVRWLKYVLDEICLKKIDAHSLVEEVSSLLKSRASANARDISGRTALTLCAKRGNVQLLKTLLEWGADCNDKTFTSGETPLHAAIMSRHLPCVHELIGRADIDVNWYVRTQTLLDF